ncbi:MAG TPA: hypothetical protein VE549_01515 [Myxococcaceae bacterium]|nr:hypothetical protein [Myxococcaceae bacterium]
MIGKTWVAVASAAVLLGGCQVASQPQSAKQPAQADAQQKSSPSSEKPLEGHVLEKVDDKLVLQVPERGRFTLVVTDRSEVLLDGKKSSLKHLPAGAEARASYELEGRRRVATRIEAMSDTGGAGAGHGK